MLPFFGGNDCRNLSASTENEHSSKNIMKFYGLFVQCFEGEVHSRKRKCIPFFSTLPPSFFVVVSCALC